MARAFILGASNGLGAHLARRLAEDGWSVTGSGRRPREKADLTNDVNYLRADLADPSDFATLSQGMRDADPDLVVHSAVHYGGGGRTTPSVLDVETMFRVNAITPFALIRDHLASLTSDRACSCVIVNSDSIYHANETSAVYAATKAALRILTAGLASACRSRASSVATLLLGPIADPFKVAELRRIAEARQLGEEEVVRAFLTKSNPSLVLDALIGLEPCYQSVLHISRLGTTANGMLLKLDGGASGSLV